MALTLNSTPSSTKASALLPVSGRDELRHEGQEEQRHLRVEHVGPEAAAGRRPAGRSWPCRIAPAAARSALACGAPAPAGILQRRSTAGRPRPSHFSTVKAVADVASSAPTPERGREDVDEATGRDAQPATMPARAPSAASCHDVEHVGPGVRFSSQPAAMNEQCCSRAWRSARKNCGSRRRRGRCRRVHVQVRREAQAVQARGQHALARQVLQQPPSARAPARQVDEHDVGLRRLDLQARRCRPGPRPAAAPAHGPAPAARHGGPAHSAAAAASMPAWRMRAAGHLADAARARDQLARAAQRRAHRRAQPLAEAHRDAVEAAARCAAPRRARRRRLAPPAPPRH